MSRSRNNLTLADWKLGLLAAAVVAVISFIPQVSLIVKRGTLWNGSYALIDFDEASYSAYLNSLIEGAPRRNNPYLGTDSDRESLFSIQFLPPYIIALPARAFGISASTAFILLTPLMAFASSLAIFWLLHQLTNSGQTSAVGVLIVLLCGRLISENPFSAEQTYSSFAFLRRYIPALPFPLFFLFCGFTWRALVYKSRAWAFAAGLSFALLVYSYFYLWTAAAAWFFCLAVVWLIARPQERVATAKTTAIIGGLACSALAPYFYLLSRRSTTLDTEQALMLLRTPDLLRVTEIIGILLIVTFIVYTRRKRLAWRSPKFLFIGACVASTFVVFNQQVLTGRSLQAFHYEQFVINYVVLVSMVATYRLMWWRVKIRPVVWATFAVCVGLTTAVKEAHDQSSINTRRDEAKPIFGRLQKTHVTGLTLFNNSLLAASALTDSSAPQLWAPSMHFFGDIDDATRRERFYQYLYLLGVEPLSLGQDLQNNPQVRAAVFGLHRVNPTLSQRFTPVSPDEIRSQVELYSAYINNISQQQIHRWPLAYVIIMGEPNFKNLDKWYTRSPGEKMGECEIYAVRLKQ